ncbi:MAG TPA: glycoside hydrolase family 140 protein [Clostridia bacterium]|nr:glycoside hydrolase family 140 protein [Clostridia bacterium]
MQNPLPQKTKSPNRRALVISLLAGLIAFSLLSTPANSVAAARRLKVSDNKRFLVYDNGQPFFYLGDTAWELFHRLNREEANQFLENRAKKGFTVIQAVAIAELDGHAVPNPYGHLPLVDFDPARPAVLDGPDNDYWDHVDYIVNKAESLGLYIGFLPTWGRYWHDAVRDGRPLFTIANAETYGEWLGKRYRDKAVIWILGGDRNVENDQQRAVLAAMARGLRRGDGGAHLITLHPCGGCGSAQWFRDAEWLDFNMRQNGHGVEFTGRYEKTRQDYDRTPLKPVIDGEPVYEDHPVDFAPDKFGHSIAADVRRPLYWNLFSGACGHTYGNHAIWQMWAPGRGPINNPLMPWNQALEQPGAGQMQFGRKLIESRPFLTRIPDPEIIVTDRVPTSMPGAGRYRFVATRDESGSYAMVYAPVGRSFKVRMNKISGAKIKAWWFNPRDGSAKSLGTFPNGGEREFTPPNKGEMLDWVLVLDDASKKFPAPGSERWTGE